MKRIIETFYTAFSSGDTSTMVSCYHDDVIFEDPAFGKLKGDQAKNMWRMLCANSNDLKVEFSHIEATLESGKAHWEAWYTFSKTGRSVHNKIDAQFEFKDGKIIKHIDDFNLHKWASQAMGWKGRLLGGTTFFKKKLHQQTHRMLHKFMTS